MEFLSDNFLIDGKDLLQHEFFIECILKAVNLAKTPFNIAIYGSAGMGRTSLMKRMAKKLTNEGSFYPLWFNAREHKSEPNLVWPLLKLLKGKIMAKGGLAENEFRSLGKAFLDLGTRPVTEVANDMMLAAKFQALEKQLTTDAAGSELFSDKGQEAKYGYEKLVKTMLKERNKEKLIFFIDDLDKCAPDKIAEFLELVELFLAADKCYFIFALDSQIIVDALNSKYPESKQGVNREKYLEKFFGFNFHIPVMDKTIRDVFIAEQKEELAVIEKGFELKTGELIKLFDIASINTPRGIKKALNRALYFLQAIPSFNWETFKTHIDEDMKFANEFLKYNPKTRGTFFVLEEHFAEVLVKNKSIILFWIIISDVWKELRDFVEIIPPTMDGQGNLSIIFDDGRLDEKSYDASHLRKSSVKIFQDFLVKGVESFALTEGLYNMIFEALKYFKNTLNMTTGIERIIVMKAVDKRLRQVGL
ncbi:MAG: hypothetical protein HZA78_07475 [Candidatus Schekmanbacteria bacterium]|nr:hypothetical protein [Candidatus Schekmanbacteria bacterium]